MPIYSIAILHNVAHKLFNNKEYLESRVDGDTRGIAAGKILEKVYYSLQLEIYTNPSAFLSTKNVYLENNELYILYKHKGRGKFAMDKYVSVMFDRYFGPISYEEIPSEINSNEYYSGVYAIPNIIYYKYLDIYNTIDINDIVSKALKYFYKKYAVFTQTQSLKNIKFNIRNIIWEELKRYKGYGDSVIDHWIAFALEEYYNDVITKI
jgi:hypothetical protein